VRTQTNSENPKQSDYRTLRIGDYQVIYEINQNKKQEVFFLSVTEAKFTMIFQKYSKAIEQRAEKCILKNTPKHPYCNPHF